MSIPATTWVCQGCGEVNDIRHGTCPKCAAANPDAPPWAVDGRVLLPPFSTGRRLPEEEPPVWIIACVPIGIGLFVIALMCLVGVMSLPSDKRKAAAYESACRATSTTYDPNGCSVQAATLTIASERSPDGGHRADVDAPDAGVFHLAARSVRLRPGAYHVRAELWDGSVTKLMLDDGSTITVDDPAARVASDRELIRAGELTAAATAGIAGLFGVLLAVKRIRRRRTLASMAGGWSTSPGAGRSSRDRRSRGSIDR